MRVLIVESTNELARLWSRYFERQGAQVTVATRAEQAIELICDTPFDVIVLDLVLTEGSALAVADFAQYRQPETNVIFVTDTTFFSDGSIFAFTPNARALVRTRTPPEDLVAMVAHYGSAA